MIKMLEKKKNTIKSFFFLLFSPTVVLNGDPVSQAAPAGLLSIDKPADR